MIHKWNMYANQGERRIPELIDNGEIDLPCINPSADSYRQQFDPEPLWAWLQNQSDLSERGLYLSLYCTERPIYDGKLWFVFTAYTSTGENNQANVDREVSWVNVRGIQFWSASFREYARIYQARTLIDYSVYVSRTFGYCFILGTMLGSEDDEEPHEFTNFYPSIHHYHLQVAVSEIDLYQPFNNDYNWFSKDYGQDPGIEQGVAVEAPTLVQVADRVAASMENWSNVLNDSPLDELVDLGDDVMEGEED